MMDDGMTEMTSIQELTLGMLHPCCTVSNVIVIAQMESGSQGQMWCCGVWVLGVGCWVEYGFGTEYGKTGFMAAPGLWYGS
jgi:hypothetical protein